MLMTVYQFYAFFTFIASVFTNILLLSLLATRLNQKIGDYKYLMLSFSILGLTFSTVDFLNQPAVHVHGGAYILFSKNWLGFPNYFTECTIALSCSLFGTTIALLAVHFVYRYFAICNPIKLKFFKWPYSLAWFVFCAEITLEWLITAHFFASSTNEIDRLLSDTMKIRYNLTVGEYIYKGNLYYDTDDNGSKHVSWSDVMFAINVIKIINICILIVMFCGIATFRKMREFHYTSKRTSDLQKQLFKALVAQTTIPMMAMYLPASVIILTPLLDADIGSWETMIIPMILTYTFLDPVVVIYFVHDYRKAIWDSIRCRRLPWAKNNSSIRITTSVVNLPPIAPRILLNNV